VTVAAKVFQIIGIVVLALSVFLFIFVLPMVARFLKKMNSTLSAKAGVIGGQVKVSLAGIDTAQGQLEAVSAVTASVKSGMAAAISTSDRVITFLKSGVFQAGLPVLTWILLLAIALPRGLRKRKKKKKKVTPIPPPSWEKAAGAR